MFHGNNLRQVVGFAQYDSGSIWPAVVGGVVGGVVVLSIFIFLVFVCVGHRNYKAQIRNTEMEMENLMQHSRREVMTGMQSILRFIRQFMCAFHHSLLTVNRVGYSIQGIVIHNNVNSEIHGPTCYQCL